MKKQPSNKRGLPKTVFVQPTGATFYFAHKSAESAARFDDNADTIVGRYELVEVLKLKRTVSIQSI